MFRKTLNKKVEEASSKLSKLDSTLEDEKGLTLDENPTTEDPITVYVRRERNLIGDELKAVTEETRKSGYFKRQNKNEFNLQTLNQLIDRIDLLRRTVTQTTLSRQDLGIVAELAFKEDPRKSQCLSELRCRSPVWVTVDYWESLRTKFTVCEKLSLDESQLIHWWHGNASIKEVSSVLDNMSNLARKIVSLREKGKSLDSHTTPDLGSFQMRIEDLTTITTDLVQLLIKFPNHEHELVDIFILLVFTTFTMTSIVSKDPEDIVASNTILKELVTKLEDLCATIGGRLGAQPYINAANNANINSSTKPNFSTLAPSVDEFELDKADALITTGLVPNRSRLQKMMSKFTDKLRVTTFQTLSNVEQKPFIPTRRFSIQDLVDMKLERIDLNFSKSKHLGTGSYGEIYSYETKDGLKQYAVKKPLCKHSSSNQRTWNRLVREAENWSKLQHINICRLHGYCEIPGYAFPGLVMDECIDSIDKYLKRDDIPVIKTADRFLLLAGIASGLSYMHELNIAHGDLRAANVLIRRQPSGKGVFAVLADFGVTDMTVEIGERIAQNSTGQKTNEAWLAPEYFAGKSGVVAISKPADVYAFGCVFLEVRYEKDPYAYCRDDKQLSDYSTAKLKKAKKLPARASDVTDAHYSFIESVCSFDPNSRPKSREIITTMEEYAAQAVQSSR